MRSRTSTLARSVCVAALAMAAIATHGVQPAGAVIRLVGTNPVGVPDPLGSYTVLGPPGAVVVISFAACGELNVCSFQGGPGIVVSCAANTISGITNAVGVATFSIVGARIPGGGAAPIGPCAPVTVDGAPAGVERVAAFDLNGVGGVTAIDLGIWASDLVSGIAFTRSDYDGNGVIDALDLGIFAAALLGGGSVLSCAAAYCP